MQYFSNLWSEISSSFYKSVIKESRYLHLLEGLKNTLIMSLFAIILGVTIGIIIAVVKELSRNSNNKIYKLLSKLCDIYVNLIRGTPGVLQLMIMYYIVFKGIDVNVIIVGILTFGISSGAYVSEVIRAGITSIDKGQNEAAKSLGLTYYQRMRYVIMPQAIRNILPALGNEFITLVKETSIAGYIGIKDLSKAATIVSSRTYDYFFPLLIIAIIYIVIVLTLTKLMNILEKRLKNNVRA